MIIQFSHDGNELNLSSRSRKNGVAYRFDTPITGFRYWNNEQNHKRKFMKHQGWYLENSGNTIDTQPKKGDLYFWGEWEPQSRFELTGNPYSNANPLPHAIHYPVFSTRGIGRHNTDPFIFGNHFYYTNCKQGTYPMLRSLNNGSIIIYGSEINKSDFVVDTIFVVGSSETVADYHTHRTQYPSLLRQATIDLHNGLQQYFRFYKGRMYNFNNHYSENKFYTFCFIPCKIDCEATGFKRPVIDWRKFNFKQPGAGTVTKRVEYSSENDLWLDLVAEIIKQGFSLGIKFEMPLNNDLEEFPEYEVETPKG